MRNNFDLPGGFRDALDTTLLAMTGCPAKGHEFTTVQTVAIIDQPLRAATMMAAIQAGLSFVLVHIPLTWDVSKPLSALGITALDVGVRMQGDLTLWSPSNGGRSLFVGGDGAYAVTADGLERVPLPLGAEASTHAGFARALRRMMRTATAFKGPGVSLAA